ncbi:hypothetical protein JS532_09160 [Bifidobacterium callimiconis]|uniref:hypothetical protein n=1 Tax=Bifidobacterium callimiconis TaxID=2306973 RepID=UPI001BDBB49C|nr:hypothetical protein [Bifidobacterium callimiconis]MBT1177722.1 hypothetical protein [Bifidobacterium callimiconis]
MAGKELDAETKAYLETLPAVESVMSGRIYYNDAFKNYVVKRCAAGDSPTRIFRAAGLGPSIIGRKRIERCVARWRSRAARYETQRADEQGSASQADESTPVTERADDTAIRSVLSDRDAVSTSERSVSEGPSFDVVFGDVAVEDGYPLRCNAFDSPVLTPDDPAYWAPRLTEAARPSGASSSDCAVSGSKQGAGRPPGLESAASSARDANLVALNRRIDTMEALLRQQLRHMQRLEDDLALLRSRLTPRQ